MVATTKRIPTGFGQADVHGARLRFEQEKVAFSQAMRLFARVLSDAFDTELTDKDLPFLKNGREIPTTTKKRRLRMLSTSGQDGISRP
jgi:hypothetical protein